LHSTTNGHTVQCPPGYSAKAVFTSARGLRCQWLFHMNKTTSRQSHLLLCLSPLRLRGLHLTVKEVPPSVPRDSPIPLHQPRRQYPIHDVFVDIHGSLPPPHKPLIDFPRPFNRVPQLRAITPYLRAQTRSRSRSWRSPRTAVTQLVTACLHPHSPHLRS
jgi:hypothetical protein